MSRRNRRNALGEIASVASALRSDAAAHGPTPDLTSAILSQVDAQRPFLNRATRRAIWIGRFGLGASVAVVVLGACLAWRFWPEKMDLSNQPAPLSALVDTVGDQASTQLVSLRQTIGPAGQAEASRFVSSIALRVDGRNDRGTELGPTIPAFEAFSRGVVVQPATLNRQITTTAKYRLGSPAHSTINSAEIRPAMFTVDTPVRAGSLIDEHDLDAGLGPK